VLNSILSYSVEKSNTEGKSDLEDSSGRLEYNRKEQERVEKQERLYSVIKDKVNAVSKMRKVFRVIREENDNIVKLKALSPSGRLPAGILSKGSEAIAEALSSFENARNADLENMQFPGASKPGSPKKNEVSSKTSFQNENQSEIVFFKKNLNRESSVENQVSPKRSSETEKRSGVVFLKKK